MNSNETAAPAAESKTEAAPASQPEPKQEASAPAKQPASAPETPPASPKPAEAPKPTGTISLKAPEGEEVTPEVLNIFAESAGAAGLTSEAAQSVLNSVIPRLAEMHAKQVDLVRKDWADKVKSDPTIGGGNLPQTLAAAKKVVETYGDAELGELLEKTGLRDHPAVLRFMRKAGASLREDKPVLGGAHTGETSLAKRMFPDFK